MSFKEKKKKEISHRKKNTKDILHEYKLAHTGLSLRSHLKKLVVSSLSRSSEISSNSFKIVDLF